MAVACKVSTIGWIRAAFKKLGFFIEQGSLQFGNDIDYYDILLIIRK
jgi:hypothetical protein